MTHIYIRIRCAPLSLQQISRWFSVTPTHFQCYDSSTCHKRYRQDVHEINRWEGRGLKYRKLFLDLKPRWSKWSAPYLTLLSTRERGPCTHPTGRRVNHTPSSDITVKEELTLNLAYIQPSLENDYKCKLQITGKQKNLNQAHKCCDHPSNQTAHQTVVQMQQVSCMFIPDKIHQSQKNKMVTFT
jgi:hypothetical protein